MENAEYIDNTFVTYGLSAKDKLIVELLQDMSMKLARIVDLLEQQGRIRPG